MVLPAEEWASPRLDQDVTAGPTAEGQAGAPSAPQGRMEQSGLSTRPGFSKEGEEARVSSRCEEGGPRRDQQNGAQARPGQPGGHVFRALSVLSVKLDNQSAFHVGLL